VATIRSCIIRKLLRDLVREGKLTPAHGHKGKVTFHDPCYLGRYNDIYEARVTFWGLSTAWSRWRWRGRTTGVSVVAAGGGRMWMEEREGKRVNIERTEEALGTGAGVIGTGCPFCMTMLNRRRQREKSSTPVEVKDIAELLLEAVEESSA